MKRLLYDVSRWHLFLHRDSRGLPQALPEDAARRKLEDELFERLYAGAAEPCEMGSSPPDELEWAKRVHETCDALPAFTRLASECRGDELAAATAVETLLNELGDVLEHSEPTEQRRLRLGLAQACSHASEAVSEQREVMEGLSGVAAPGNSPGEERAPRDGATSRALAARLREDPRLKEIGRLAGRFKRVLTGKRRQRVPSGSEEVVSVELGAELERLLPSQFIRLRRPLHRLAFLRDLLERQCLQYELAGSDALGKGPLIVCLDKSDSMTGEKDVFAVAAALALHAVAEEERRRFALVTFDSTVRTAHLCAARQGVPPELLFANCSGGTDIADALESGLQFLTGNSPLARADLVLITDGESSTERAEIIREQARASKTEILALGIGVSPEALLPWCSEHHLVRSISELDEGLVETLSRL
jgi:uncharacterized protein with von Willebrand factor type A (vWA) domain